MFFFFFSSRRRHTRSLRDWSSDVCSSDLWFAPTLQACTASSRRMPRDAREERWHFAETLQLQRLLQMPAKRTKNRRWSCNTQREQVPRSVRHVAALQSPEHSHRKGAKKHAQQLTHTLPKMSEVRCVHRLGEFVRLFATRIPE